MKPSQSFLPLVSTIASLIAGAALFTAATAFAQKSDDTSPTEAKVTLCHNGHSITVSQSAVPAHQAHGDLLGPCPSESKVLLCHGGHTIRVDQNSVAAHLAHGDNLGPCSTFANQGATDPSSFAALQARSAAAAPSAVSPNAPLTSAVSTEVAICYKGHTVKVAPTAVQTYLSIGAALGPCEYKDASGAKTEASETTISGKRSEAGAVGRQKN